MKRIQGQWSKNSNEKKSIGELVIDKDYIEFSVRDNSAVFNTTFTGSDGDHSYKVYTLGKGKSKYKKIENCYEHRVDKGALSNGKFQDGYTIKNITSFSFEIPELVEWLGIQSVEVGYTANNELCAIEKKIDCITLKKNNPSIEIKYGPAPLIHSEYYNDRIEFLLKNSPRIYVTYEDAVNDNRVKKDIQIIMNFFGLLCGYVSYADDIRLDIKGEEMKTWLYFNKDFSFNLKHINLLDEMFTKYKDVRENLSMYFEGWYKFCQDSKYDIPRDMFFDSNTRREMYSVDLFIINCKILEGYDLRVNKDEEKADELGDKIKKQLKEQKEAANLLFSTIFKEAGSKYNANSVSQWIKSGFLGRKPLAERIRALDKANFSVIGNSSKFILNNHDEDLFKAIGKTRNFLEHYKYDRNGVMEWVEVDTTIGALKCLIIIIFYKRMGMSDNDIKNIMVNNSEFWTYTSHLKSEAE